MVRNMNPNHNSHRNISMRIGGFSRAKQRSRRGGGGEKMRFIEAKDQTSTNDLSMMTKAPGFDQNQRQRTEKGMCLGKGGGGGWVYI